MATSDEDTCMCGDPMDAHNIGSGHTPVSMADYYRDDTKTCTAPGCTEPRKGDCAACDRPRCEDHSFYSNEAGERFCNVDMEHGIKFWETRCAK